MTHPAAHAAFLAAICADPDDDLPRLVFADWLDERGDPLGEFVRVQCEIATLTVPKYPGILLCEGKGGPLAGKKRCKCRPCFLRRRERELLSAKSCLDWFAVPGLATSWTATDGFVGWIAKRRGEGGRTIRASVRRGFVEEVRMAWNREHITAIRESTPLRRVRLTTWPIDLYGDDTSQTRWLLVTQATNGYRGTLGAMFPGVEFQLPRLQPQDEWDRRLAQGREI